MNAADTVSFICNICGNRCNVPHSQLSREEASCAACGSTVRMRSVVHCLSLGLFGVSVALPHFPREKAIRGIGMSDWDGYAAPLSDRLSYTNTYYHTEPRLDIMDIPKEMEGTLDFVISTDVFEHVLSPISRAFQNTKKLLKPGGVFVFTVPFTLEGSDTIEHFKDLHQFEILEEKGEMLLKNETVRGEVVTYRNLVFHGGPGHTLEMRLFCRESLLAEFKAAGFKDIQVHDQAFMRHGVFHRETWSLPITARA